MCITKSFKNMYIFTSVFYPQFFIIIGNSVVRHFIYCQRSVSAVSAQCTCVSFHPPTISATEITSRKTSRCATSVPIKYTNFVRQAQLLLLYAKLHISTLIIGHLQAFLQLSLKMLCTASVNLIVRRPEDDP